MDYKDIIDLFSWKKILRQVWEDLKPKLEEKVSDTESKWDDVAFNALETLVQKFLYE